VLKPSSSNVLLPREVYRSSKLPLRRQRSRSIYQECNWLFCNKQAHHEEAFHEHWCDTCNEVFSSEGALEGHYAVYHVHPYNECGRTLRTVEGIERHQDAVHDFECDNCNLSFPTHSALQQHVSSRHALKRYICVFRSARKPHLQNGLFLLVSFWLTMSFWRVAISSCAAHGESFEVRCCLSGPHLVRPCSSSMPRALSGGHP
jgi:hypothetical protein